MTTISKNSETGISETMPKNPQDKEVEINTNDIKHFQLNSIKLYPKMSSNPDKEVSIQTQETFKATNKNNMRRIS